MALGIVAAVGATRQVQRPVRRDQGQAVPAIAPRLRHAGALEDHVIDAADRESLADCESGLSGADDDDAHGAVARKPVIRST